MKTYKAKSLPKVSIQAGKVFGAKDSREEEIAVDEVNGYLQVGGEPMWIQYDETPTCDDCGDLMTFIGAFPTTSFRMSIGDMGRIYVFYCFKCQPNTKTVMQCH
jgi:hypothetical protein